MLPGYWQAGAFPNLYWQDQGNYWPHFAGGPSPAPGTPGGGPGIRFGREWVPPAWFNDDDEVLIILK